MAITKLQEKGEELEIELRGATLNVSIKFETMIMSIIYFSNVQQYHNPQQSPSLKLKNLTFGGKLNRVKELLNSFHPDLLVHYESLFADLDGFKVIRNRMAHCELRWTDNNLENLELWDVHEDATKMQFYFPIKYTRLDLANILVDYMAKISNPLLSLVVEVQNRLNNSEPAFFDLLLPAEKKGQ